MDFILSILDPIDELIKMSESDHSLLQHVIPRWKSAQKHLQVIMLERSDIDDLKQLDEKILMP